MILLLPRFGGAFSLSKQSLEKVEPVCYNMGITLLKLPANGTEGTSWN